jgi:hypothetical protein
VCSAVVDSGAPPQPAPVPAEATSSEGWRELLFPQS